jgi:hypothetical protein
MHDPATLLLQRALWLASALLLLFGTLMLAFSIGWMAIETITAVRGGAIPTEHGRRLFTFACVAISGGLITDILHVRYAARLRPRIVRRDGDVQTLPLSRRAGL